MVELYLPPVQLRAAEPRDAESTELCRYKRERASGRAGGQYPRKGNLYALSIKEDRLITGLTRAACGSLCHRIGIIIYHQSALLLWHKERPQMDLTNKQTERRIMCLLWMQVR